jgi:hypothetical protein
MAFHDPNMAHPKKRAVVKVNGIRVFFMLLRFSVSIFGY